MKNEYDIKETEIRVLGLPERQSNKEKGYKKWIGILVLAVIACLIMLLAILYFKKSNVSQSEQTLIETETEVPSSEALPQSLDSGQEAISQQGYAEVIDTIINNIPMRIFIPHYSKVSLHIGIPNTNDSSIIYIAQAADIRADNKKILGAFVMDGEPLAWGISKKGYCAIIDNEVQVGVATNTPLFEEATSKDGYFFRQYPLVRNGRICENEPKGTAMRRAICQRGAQTFMVHSAKKESFHDFSQALVDLGCDNAVYLRGSDAWGWCINANGERETWGVERLKTQAKSTSYIVFKK